MEGCPVGELVPEQGEKCVCVSAVQWGIATSEQGEDRSHTGDGQQK